MTQLVLPTSVGMVSLVLISLAHPTPSSMELSAFALTQVIDACHGNSSTEKSAFISKTLVPKAPNGTEHLAFPTQATAPTVTTNKATNASPSLNNVLPPPTGTTTGASPLEPALTVRSEKPTAASPTLLARTAKAGTQVSCNVSVPKEPDGTERSALSAEEARSGTCKMAALAPKDSSWPEPAAKNQLKTCAD